MSTAATADQCGARRPGWEHGPAIGINRIPCVLPKHDQGDHANAYAQTWTNTSTDTGQTDTDGDEHMTREWLNGTLPEPTPALCIGCKCLTTAPVVVRCIESASGPGTTLYACPTCAPKLTPGPTPDHTVMRRR
ncbi:hypothetical protein OG897_20875 [Streptomyces sp. NBC_00237]|uniref:hypothetical protein n=1 Tax=Streptomyces sp. NBC_00237 TaxID=2975687 RepID=UPI002254C594|nr:hypothetical protein [Streptomyces sp. NBC_00237]MCX5203898.1 hypothetical protein [Streptomyces sp. NBC_00237]